MGISLYIYFYAHTYPIPIFHRVSLDAKIKFVKDLKDREKYDTVIIGSSIGLNNIQGAVLEKSSKTIKHVINLSSLGLKMTQIEQLLDILSFFPNVHRVIQSAELEDFSQEFVFNTSDINFAKRYIALGEKPLDISSFIYTFKNFIEFAKNNWKWNTSFLPHNTNACLDFDYTGSVDLRIYGEDINQHRWHTPPSLIQGEKNFKALHKVAKNLKQKGIQFYFIVEPYRQPLIDKYPKLKTLRDSFSHRAKKIVKENNGFFLELHNKMKLGDTYFVDREHLNTKGSQLTAKEVAKFVDKIEKSTK